VGCCYLQEQQDAGACRHYLVVVWVVGEGRQGVASLCRALQQLLPAAAVMPQHQQQQQQLVVRVHKLGLQPVMVAQQGHLPLWLHRRLLAARVAQLLVGPVVAMQLMAAAA
jgi:hypothetical protein